MQSDPPPPSSNPGAPVSIQMHGARLTFQPDGNIAIDLKEIKSVGIKNVMEVEVHGIHTVANSRSHYIRFYGGGEVRFAYNQDGQLIELTSRNVTLSLTPEHEVIFSRRAEESQA